jgi:hypothetical protein
MESKAIGIIGTFKNYFKFLYNLLMASFDVKYTGKHISIVGINIHIQSI